MSLPNRTFIASKAFNAGSVVISDKALISVPVASPFNDYKSSRAWSTLSEPGKFMIKCLQANESVFNELIEMQHNFEEKLVDALGLPTCVKEVRKSAAEVQSRTETIFSALLKPHHTCSTSIQETLTNFGMIWILNAHSLNGRSTSGAFPMHSLLTHTCRNPNSAFTCSSETPSQIALRDISAGKEVTTSYLPLTVFTIEERRQILWQDKGFFCQCPHCKDEPDWARGLWCPAKTTKNGSEIDCEGTVYHHPEDNNQWKCSVCKELFTNEDIIQQHYPNLCKEEKNFGRRLQRSEVSTSAKAEDAGKLYKEAVSHFGPCHALTCRAAIQLLNIPETELETKIELFKYLQEFYANLRCVDIAEEMLRPALDLVEACAGSAYQQESIELLKQCSATIEGKRGWPICHVLQNDFDSSVM